MRGGQVRKPAGFQPDLVCLTPWVNGEAPAAVQCLTLNAAFGLLAYGNGSGLVIVDFVQHKCLLNMGTADLYGSNDPYQRMPRSPAPLANSPKLEDFIVKVDLCNYTQATDKKEENGKEEVEVAKEAKEGNGTDKPKVRHMGAAPRYLFRITPLPCCLNLHFYQQLHCT